MPSALNEASLEKLIVTQMCAVDTTHPAWIEGTPGTFNAGYALDLHALVAFLEATQPELAKELDLASSTPAAQKALVRIRDEITKRGVVDCLRNGINHHHHSIDLYYPTPNVHNPAAITQFEANIFTVTRQVHFSPTTAGKSLDLVAFVNGLPVFTFELKNLITKQTVEDAVKQYKTDRSPQELVFKIGRTIAHFAVDDQRAQFSTKLVGTASVFLPFDQGRDGGAGNPLNPDGVATDYLWRSVLEPRSLANIIENYAQVTEIKQSSGKVKRDAIFPRYHQLDVTRKLLADVRASGSGRRYLIQHSAGSGKSNSIAWLAHQLVTVEHEAKRAFDTVLVVTDRVILDGQIQATIKNFTQVHSTVKHATSSAELKAAIETGTKIVITTVQKFPYIASELGGTHRDKSFAIIIDEAHSSQSGSTAKSMAQALSLEQPGEIEDLEDVLNQLIASKKMLPNASYFAFTATPKNKTLETFGTKVAVDGVEKFVPFHVYSMKQAIEEGFIVDVLANYIPIDTYYKLMKTIEDDPEFDAKRSSQKLRVFVEGQTQPIRQKAAIMMDHFHAQVFAPRKIGGQARAMVVTSSIKRAITYYGAINEYLEENKRPYKAIVAFSDHTDKQTGNAVTESQYNKFPGSEIPTRFVEDPYRILIVADKFQTGYDEPLLHTMYVDKPLSGVKAVQTLSRLNRAMPGKSDVAVLDFFNDAETIAKSFQDYYKTTILAEATDPNKLHDLEKTLRDAGIFTDENVDYFVDRYLHEAGVEELHPLLDASVHEYLERDVADQIEFKGTAKAFVRTYGFLSAVLPYADVEWEKLAIYLGFLVPKLPSPAIDDLADGVTKNVDLEYFRAEKQAAMTIALEDTDSEVPPVPPVNPSPGVDPEMERLSEIIAAFHARWGNTSFTDQDRILKHIIEELPQEVLEHPTYKVAAENPDSQNAKVALAKVLKEVMLRRMGDDLEFFKAWAEDKEFAQFMLDTIFRQTYWSKA